MNNNKPVMRGMLPFSLLLLSLLCVVVEGAKPTQQQSLTITHQAHSFDDLGEWRQLIAKGTNFLKVDLHYVLAPVCETQPRVLNTDTRGCYLLTHDAPQASEVYYTTTDLIAFLIDSDNKYLFAGLRNFYLYLAFKNNRDRYPAANITQSNNLQIEFMHVISNNIYLYNPKVVLIYDGTYYNEYLVPYTWPRTYAFTVPDLNNPDSCLYSSEGYHCRNTAVINNMANPLPFVDPALSLSLMCKVDFGKFSKTAYPWVFFEPTDQRTVLYMLDSYLNCSIEHAPGFAISINIDPVQYQIYAGTRSGKAWNERLFDDAQWAHAVPLLLSPDATSLTFLVLHLSTRISYSIAQGSFDTQKNGTTFPFGPVSIIGEGDSLELPFAASPFQKLKTFSFSAGGVSYVFISDFRGLAGIYALDAPSSLRLVVNVTLGHKQSETVSLVSATQYSDDIQSYIEIQFLQGYVSYLVGDACSFLIQWWRLRFDMSGYFPSELIPLADPFCAVASTAVLSFAVDGASLSVAPTPATNTTYCVNATHGGVLVVSSKKIIYGGVLCANAETHTITLCADESCAPSQPQLRPTPTPFPHLAAQQLGLTPLDVGTFPSVTLSSTSDGEPIVLEVHGDGYCYNSDWNNKRAFPRVCKSTPVSSRYVLNYNYGRLSDWAEHIFAQAGMISSCDTSIFHGAYDEGSLPSAFMTVDHKGNMRMVEAHTGFPVGAVDWAGCSFPVPYDGAMIDGIVLPSLDLMKGQEWSPSSALLKYLTPANNTQIYTSPPSEMTLPLKLCDMCKQKIFDWQSKYQADYEMIHKITYKLTELCNLGRLVLGDGTVAGCQNLIMLYVPSLAVDIVKDVFSPDNCNILPVCNSTGDVDILPGVGSSGNLRSIDPEERVAKANIVNIKNEQEMASIDNQKQLDDEATTKVKAALHSVAKEILYEVVGFRT